jgi:hypothetical protein
LTAVLIDTYLSDIDEFEYHLCAVLGIVLKQNDARYPEGDTIRALNHGHDVVGAVLEGRFIPRLFEQLDRLSCEQVNTTDVDIDYRSVTTSMALNSSQSTNVSWRAISSAVVLSSTPEGESAGSVNCHTVTTSVRISEL